eukprot:COSAG01_NODE_32489_length_580_cov_1.172557_1_plen_128_part_10
MRNITPSGPQSVHYTVDPGYPLPDPAINSRFGKPTKTVYIQTWNAETLQPIGQSGVKVGGGFLPVPLSGRSYEVNNSWPNCWKCDTKIGQILTIGPRMGHTVVLSNSTRCAVEGVNVFGVSDVAHSSD